MNRCLHTRCLRRALRLPARPTPALFCTDRFSPDRISLLFTLLGVVGPVGLLQAATAAPAVAQTAPPSAHKADAHAALPGAPAPLSTAAAALPAGAMDQGVQLVQQAASMLAPAGARLRATPGTPDARLRLAPCAAATAHLVTGAPAWGATRFGLRCTQGARWSIQVPVQVQVFAPAVVAQAALPAGSVPALHQLALAEVDWAAHAPPPSSGAAQAGLPQQPALFSQVAALQDRRLVRPLAPGAPVRALDLQSRQWFAAGENVNVVAAGEGFAVSAAGQALSPGLEGQLVRVRTENGRVITGFAAGPRRVELRL